MSRASFRITAAVVALWGLSVTPAYGQPPQPTPVLPGPATSTTEELADMVLDAIEGGSIAAPTTSVLPTPQP